MVDVPSTVVTQSGRMMSTVKSAGGKPLKSMALRKDSPMTASMENPAFINRSKSLACTFSRKSTTDEFESSIWAMMMSMKRMEKG